MAFDWEREPIRPKLTRHFFECQKGSICHSKLFCGECVSINGYVWLQQAASHRNCLRVAHMALQANATHPPFLDPTLLARGDISSPPKLVAHLSFLVSLVLTPLRWRWRTPWTLSSASLLHSPSPTCRGTTLASVKGPSFGARGLETRPTVSSRQIGRHPHDPRQNCKSKKEH